MSSSELKSMNICIMLTEDYLHEIETCEGCDELPPILDFPLTMILEEKHGKSVGHFEPVYYSEEDWEEFWQLPYDGDKTLEDCKIQIDAFWYNYDPGWVLTNDRNMIIDYKETMRLTEKTLNQRVFPRVYRVYYTDMDD